MSAPETGRRASFSSAGYEDGFGRRTLVFDREQGATIERLVLRPVFGVFEASLTVRAARLADTPVAGIAGPTRVHRLQPRGPLVAESALPAGDRLSDLLEAASEGAGDQAAGGVDAALGFLLAALPIVETLHTQYGMVHGAIGPGRLMITPDARVAVLDAIYADALQTLALPRRRLWTDFALACAPAAGPTRFTPGGDVAQLSLTALMILLGRAPAYGDVPDGLQAAIAEATEIAEIRGGSELATGIRAVMELALPGSSASPSSAAAANQEVRRFVDATVGITPCRAALAAFADAARQLPLPPPKVSVVPQPSRLAVPRPLDIAPIVSAPLEVHIEIPEPPQTGEAEKPAEPVVQPFETAVAPNDAAAVPADATSEPLDSQTEPLDQTAEPIGLTGGEIENTTEPTEAAATEVEVAVSEPVAHEPSDSAPTAVLEPARLPERSAAPTRTGKNKRRRRAKEKDRERPVAVPPAPVSTWRSVDPPAAATPAPARPTPPQPVFPQPVVAQPVFSPPSYPGGGQAQTSPYLESAGKVWQPAPVAATPVPVVPVAAVPAVSAAKPIGIRLKNDPHHPAPTHRHAPAPRDYDEFPRTYREPSRRRWPWGPVAALIALGVAGVYGARAYLPAGSADAAPVRAEAAPARTTGTLVITSIPSGARVLIDGQPAGETPLTLDSVTPGQRTVTVTSGGGSARRTVDVEAGDSLELSIPVYSGWLAIEAPIVLEVSQGGRVLGTTEQSRMLLPPGRHTISVSNRNLGYKAAHTVTIEPGEERRLSLTPSSEVNLNASPWAEVWIDGRHVGETPLSRLAVPLGTREIVFKHPQYGERRLTPTIRYRDPAAITVDMTKPDGN